MNKLSNLDVLTDNLIRQSGNTCLTAIIPFGQKGGWNKQPISQMITKASQYFQTQRDDIIKNFEMVLEDMTLEVHYNRHCTGVGFFISNEVRKIFRFVFPVKEKFTVADKFEISDLLYHAQYAQPGYILQLTGKGAHLFSTGLLEASEITGNHFPLAYTEDYEFTPPARTSSYTGHAVTQQFEKDKSRLQEMHYEKFLKQVDRHIAGYINAQQLFVVTGPPKALNSFLELTAHTKQIAGILPSHYPHASAFELHQLTLPVFHQYVDDRISSSVRLLNEKIGEGLAVGGIADCWNAAVEGKGLLLLAEKDYAPVAFLEQENDTHLYLSPPRKKHRIVTNAVNELMFTILARKGRVLITQSGLLREHQRVGLIKRYE